MKPPEQPKPKWKRTGFPILLALMMVAGLLAMPASAEENQTLVGTCDYSQAHLHGGWGWDETNGVSCEPVEDTTASKQPPPQPLSARQDTPAGADTCDYSQAHLHGGWGWDETNGVSCEPVEDTTTQEVTQTVEETAVTALEGCDYSEAHFYNGWGYNHDTGESCEPLANTAVPAPAPTPADTPAGADTCDYSQAHLHGGWGWDATNGVSCEPLPLDAEPVSTWV